MLRRAGYDTSRCSSAASGSAACGTTTPTRAPPATSRRTSTSSRSPQPALVAPLRAPGRDPGLPRGRRPRHGVLDRIRTGTEVTSARWDEDAGRWTLETSAGPHEADVLVTACGQLSVPKAPPLPGLDTFDGPAFHTARWRHDVELAGKRVAVDRDRLQRDPDRPGDPAAGRADRRLPALARLDVPEDGLRLLASAPSGCSSASRCCSGWTARRSSPSRSSAPRR